MGKTGIIGGGASGMMAAVAAARGGETVTILERRDRIGKKILATGNGRCNLSNLDFCVERDYRSADPERLEGYFSQFGVKETLSFFHGEGMLTTDRNGYLYPRSMQASAVLELFRDELERQKVQIVCSCDVKSVRKRGRFVVCTDQGDFTFDRLILACGSAAGTPKKEGLGGFELAGRLGLLVHEPVPALTALRCKESFFKSLAGVRCMAKVRLEIGGRFWEECGELQLTDYGISGIPVFQCSRYAGRAFLEKKSVEAVIDFLPEISGEEWEKLCRSQYRRCEGKSVLMLGCGMLHKKIVQVLLLQSGLKPDETVGKGTRERISRMFALMRAFRVTALSVNPMESAQVCAGGVALTEVDERLQANRVPDLFLCGEMLDVDGRCGGYNLQWAWSSGYIAGNSAAQRSKERSR